MIEKGGEIALQPKDYARVPQEFLSHLKQVLGDYILVCNTMELAFVINKELQKAGYNTLSAVTLKNHMVGNSLGVSDKISEGYEAFMNVITEVAIDKKMELMMGYVEGKGKDWYKKGTTEFIFDRRFKNFGEDKVDTESDNKLTVGNIVINIDNRQINTNPIKSEGQMLEEADTLIETYLNKRGIIVDAEVEQ